MNAPLLYKEEVYAIQGAIFEVYREMGNGFLEAVYQECLERELAARGIPFLAQPLLQLSYKGLPLAQTYRPDLVCHQTIIIEIKACAQILPVHQAQVINYLKSTGLRLGLIANFGDFPKATVQRLVL